MPTTELSQTKDESLETLADETAAVEEVPELETGPEAQPLSASPPAVVAPPSGFIQGPVTRFLQRALARVPQPPAAPPAELLERLDAIEVQLAALEELMAKRLEEGEGRTLHLVEKRLEVLQDEVSKQARRAVEGQVEEGVRSVRLISVGLGVLAVILASAALVIATGIL